MKCMKLDIQRHRSHCNAGVQLMNAICNEELESIIEGNHVFRRLIGAILHHWKADHTSHIRCNIMRSTVRRNSSLRGILYNAYITFKPFTTAHAKQGTLLVAMRMRFGGRVCILALGFTPHECVESSMLMHGVIDWSSMKSKGIALSLTDRGYVAFRDGDRIYYHGEEVYVLPLLQ
jgi:hypothetical protein